MAEKETIEQYIARFKEAVNIDFSEAISNAMEGARRLNATFGQTGERITEVMQTVNNTLPRITELGGNIENVFKTLEDVSTATKKNVVASAEEAQKLYAASKVLDDSVKSIVEGFTDVGVQFTQAGQQIEKSVNYIRSIGLNTKDVMGDVSRQMENLNRFNFAGGVEGLTKMAAQAATFRFNMNDTFRVAEKALRPDGAIELASAFQRMGVAVGDLTDPFQLMNKSLNDPEGLQKSLIQMTKSYAEFDNKTKTFKINPAGMLQLRELADQTGLSYENLSKSALAAANMDRAFKQLSPNLKFDNEEDRMLLGNIAKMGKGGEYEVNIKEGGEDKKVKLSELTNTQLEKLLEQQKTGPKTLEEIAKSQLTTADLMLADVTAIKEKIVYGITGADQIRNLSANIKDFTRGAIEIIKNKVPNPEEISPKVTGIISNFETIIKEFTSGQIGSEKFKSQFASLEKTFKDLEGGATGKAKEAIVEIAQKFEKTFNVDLIERMGKLSPEMAAKLKSFKESTKDIEKTATTMYKHDMSGTVNVKIDAVPGVTTQQLQTYVDSPSFKQQIYKILLGMDDVQRETLKKTINK